VQLEKESQKYFQNKINSNSEKMLMEIVNSNKLSSNNYLSYFQSS